MKKTLYYNGKILTVNEQMPLAQAVLVSGGRIIAVGTNDALLAQQDDLTHLVDLAGKTLLPGFIDGHSHISMAKTLPMFTPPPAGEIDSLAALQAAVKKEIAAHPPKDGDWFIGMGYDNAFFANNAHPSLADLDAISTEIPIGLAHVSGHVGVVNSKALELLHITADTPDPEGGIIGRDPVTHQPTGLMEEAAHFQYIMMHMMPSMTLEKQATAYAEAHKFYASYGITTAQDGGGGDLTMPVVKYCQDHDQMLIDVCCYFMIESAKNCLSDLGSAAAEYHNHFKNAGAKLILDGSPQAKTAWLTQPYYIAPEDKSADYCGYPVYDDDTAYAFIKYAVEHHLQILTHCNGDAAGDQFIRLYQKAQQETGVTENLRPVMVHAQTVRDDQLDQMAEIGMMPTFFHDHTFYWGDYHLASVLGPDRGRRISPLRAAQERGIKYTLHQDTPVVPPNIILAIHNAVNRITKDGQEIGSEYAVDVHEAIRAVTIYGAYEYFEEDIKGTIEPGKYADFVILDKCPTEVPKAEIKNIKVLATIKENKVVFQA